AVEFAHAPRRFVRQAVMADFPRSDQRGHTLDLFANRWTCALLVGIERRRAEHRDVALRPMDLVEIDAVCLQAREARVDRLGDDLSSQIGAPLPDPVPAARSRYLAGDDEAVPRPVREP